MLYILNFLIPFFLIYIVYEFTKNKVNTKNQMIIFLIILILFANSKKIKEYFSINYLNDLNNNELQTQEFCRKLSILDKPSEDTILLKNFRNKAIQNNKNEIKKLRMEIDKYYLDNINTDIYNKNNYKVWKHKRAKKQLKVINKAKENLLKKNTVQINVN